MLAYRLQVGDRIEYTDGYFAEGVADTLVVGDFVNVNASGTLEKTLMVQKQLLHYV